MYRRLALCIIALLFVQTHAAWVNVTNGVSGANYIVCAPEKDVMYVSSTGGGIWKSIDGGSTWVKGGTGTGSYNPTNSCKRLLVDPLYPDTVWECGMYGNQLAVTSKDGGKTFKALSQSVGHNDGMAVDFSDPLRQTILVGSHETSNNLWYSGDAGSTWTNIGPNLPTGLGFSSHPVIINSTTFICACVGGWGSGLNKIMRSADKGLTWTAVSDSPAWGEALLTSKGQIYYTEIYNRGVFRSLDSGLTWKKTCGYGIVTAEWPIAECPDGRLYASAAASKGLVVSANSGQTWANFGDRTSSTVLGVAYNKARKAFFIAGGGIFRWDYDYTTPAVNPVNSRQTAASSEMISRVTGPDFIIPDSYAGHAVKAQVYASNGRLVLSKKVFAGDLFQIPRSQGNSLSIVKLTVK